MTQLVVSKTFLPLPRRRPTSFRRDRRVCPPVMPKMASQQARSVCSPPVLNAEEFRVHRVSGATVRSGRTRQLNFVHYPSTLALGGGLPRLPDSPLRPRAKPNAARGAKGRSADTGVTVRTKVCPKAGHDLEQEHGAHLLPTSHVDHDSLSLAHEDGD